MRNKLGASSAVIRECLDGLNAYQVGQAFRLHRQHFEIRASNIASASAMHVNTLYQIERGDRNAKDHELAGIVNCLCENMADLHEIARIAKTIPSSLGQLRDNRKKKSLLCWV